MACAGEAVAIPMKNTRLTVNNDVFSAEILMFTGSPLLTDLLRCHRSLDCSASGSARKDHAGINGWTPQLVSPNPERSLEILNSVVSVMGMLRQQYFGMMRGGNLLGFGVR
jgi:hypothetical protein